ncbi:MAG: hypothetical protein IPG16_22830, partial [Comamonadaceae bacterium]|nr:hypothetical protein [Comamonadaceae bacterium]
RLGLDVFRDALRRVTDATPQRSPSFGSTCDDRANSSRKSLVSTVNSADPDDWRGTQSAVSAVRQTIQIGCAAVSPSSPVHPEFLHRKVGGRLHWRRQAHIWDDDPQDIAPAVNVFTRVIDVSLTIASRNAVSAYSATIDPEISRMPANGFSFRPPPPQLYRSVLRLCLIVMDPDLIDATGVAAEPSAVAVGAVSAPEVDRPVGEGEHARAGRIRRGRVGRPRRHVLRVPRRLDLDVVRVRAVASQALHHAAR